MKVRLILTVEYKRKRSGYRYHHFGTQRGARINKHTDIRKSSNIRHVISYLIEVSRVNEEILRIHAELDGIQFQSERSGIIMNLTRR